jgi:hypothetical protein
MLAAGLGYADVTDGPTAKFIALSKVEQGAP